MSFSAMRLQGALLDEVTFRSEGVLPAEEAAPTDGGGDEEQVKDLIPSVYVPLINR
jgi:hypothetical protein